jgi:hypothetical protein
VAESAASLLGRLDRLKDNYEKGTASEKLVLLGKLERRRLHSARAVLRLHECLCFLRAYPDNRAVLARVERMLKGFSRRSDLRRFAPLLLDSGIAGTATYYGFYWPTAVWLAERWPHQLSVDWDVFGGAEKLGEILDVLVPFSESPGLDHLGTSPREWIERHKGPGETDAAFLIRRYQALDAGPFVRQVFYEDLDPFLCLAPGPDSPTRTRPKYDKSPVFVQRRPLDRKRPDLLQEIERPPRAVETVTPREGQKLIDMAREAMVTRARDLDIFMYADPNDVRMVEFEDGLQFACMGAVPERRLMLEAVYGALTLKNGVPTGYVLASAFMRSSEIAYNVFETYRGGESGLVFGRVMSMVRHLFGSDVFTLDPYQLGYGNQEGLESGAWWFYYKMGFRPYDPEVRKLLRRELATMKRNPRHRSSIATLEQLASEHVYLFLDSERKDVLGRISLGNIGLAVSRYLARRFGSDRELGLRTCASEAARLLGVRPVSRSTPGERLAWERWSPLVLALPGVRRWTPEQKRALAQVVRAKGGRRESDFVRRFDAHRRLRSAMVELARG